MSRIASEKTLEELYSEKQNLEDNIKKITDDINAKRRTVSDMKANLNAINDKIKAKKLTAVTDTITDKYGMNIDDFIKALESGKVKVDKNDSLNGNIN